MVGVGVATAATVAATVATTAASVAGSMGAFGGGGSSGAPTSSKPTSWKPVPRSPDDQAMRDFYARMLVMNANAQPPSFGDYSASGGDPSKAQFQMQMPGLSPSEMAGLGFTGKQGQAVPFTPQAQAGTQGALSAQQMIYLGRQRSKEAQQQGGPGTATPLQRLGHVSNQLDRLQGIQAPNQQQQNRINQLQQRQQQLIQRTGAGAGPTGP